MAHGLDKPMTIYNVKTRATRCICWFPQNRYKNRYNKNRQKRERRKDRERIEFHYTLHSISYIDFLFHCVMMSSFSYCSSLLSVACFMHSSADIYAYVLYMGIWFFYFSYISPSICLSLSFSVHYRYICITFASAK